MRGLLDSNIVEGLRRAISELDLNLAQIKDMLALGRLLELDEETRNELGSLGKKLHDVGKGASRATCRGLSIKASGGIKFGILFHVDDFWLGENGVLIGVVRLNRAKAFQC